MKANLGQGQEMDISALLFQKFMDRDNKSIDWKAFDRWLNSDYGRAFKASR